MMSKLESNSNSDTKLEQANRGRQTSHVRFVNTLPRKVQEYDTLGVERSTGQEVLSIDEKNEEFSFGIGDSTTLSASSIISRDGGVIKLGNTGVKLEIPPNAFQNDEEEHVIQIRILPQNILDDQNTKYFEDNSTTMVEILPNNLRLKKCAKLTLPHCLIVKNENGCKVQVFQSHHTEGEKPTWEDVSESAIPKISGSVCKLSLRQFCWVMFTIGSEGVEGKMLFIYTAGERVQRNADCVTALVGYFPALPRYNRIDPTSDDFNEAKTKRLCERKLQPYFIGGNWQPFIFRKDPQQPLEIRLTDIFPSESWKTSQNQCNPKIISYQSIESSMIKHWEFTFERVKRKADYPTCHFEISHLEEKVGIRVNLQRGQDDGDLGPPPIMYNHIYEPMEVEEIGP